MITEPYETYAEKRRDHLTSHALADFRKSPLLYSRKKNGLMREGDTSAMLVGRAAHCMILEGKEEYLSRYAVGGPINPRTGKSYGRETKAFAEWAENCGRPVLSPEQDQLIRTMAESVARHPSTGAMLATGAPELVARCHYSGIPCQGRLDWFSDDWGIIDLKTCQDLDRFLAESRRHGYAHQMSFYRSLVRELTGISVPAHIIAVEKAEPFRCGVWCVAATALDQAESENLAAMQLIKTCQQTGIWPSGYDDGIRIIDTIDTNWKGEQCDHSQTQTSSGSESSAVFTRKSTTTW